MADADLRYLIDAVDKGFSTTMSKVSKQLDETHGHLADFNEKGLQTTAKHMDGLNKGVMGVGGGMKFMGGMALSAGAALGGIAFAKLAGDGMAMATTLESSAAGFESMLGSAQKSQKFVKEMADFAAKTPFEFPELAQSAQTMMAFGWEAKDVIPTMTKVGDAVGAMGKGSEGVDRVITALGQMRAKGKVSGEEMMQLTEVGIPAWQLLADKIGVTVPEAQEKARKGQLDLDTTMTAIIDGMGEKYAGGMEKQAQTISGMMSTLKDNVGLALANVITPLLPYIKEAVGAFSEFAGVAGPKVGEVMEKLAPKIKMVFEYLKDLGQKILPHLKGWWDSVSDAVEKNRPGLEKLGQALVGIAKFVAEEVIPVLIDFSGKYLSGVLTVLGKIGEYLPDLAKFFLRMAYTGMESFQDLFDKSTDVMGGILTVAEETLGWIPGGVGDAIKGAKAGFEDWKKSADTNMTNVRGSIDGAIAKVDEWGRAAKDPNKTEAKLKADITDLQTKIGIAKTELQNPELTEERRAELKAEIKQLESQVDKAKTKMDEVKDKEVTLSASIVVSSVSVKQGVENKIKANFEKMFGGMDESYGTAASISDAGLMGATAGVGSLGAGFGVRGPRWSWDRNSQGLGKHDGADVGAPYGTPVYATRSGRITDAGWTDGWAGNRVVWTDDRGTQFIYAHLSSIARHGGAVSRGTMLGRVGSTGNADGAHLHVQASRDGSYVNPAYFLADGGIVKRRPGGTLAVIGEGRYDEAVVPLKPGTGAGGGTLEVHFHNPVIGSREDLARYITEAQLDYKRRRGTELGIS